MTGTTDTKPTPRPTPETQAFWEGCRAGEFRIQRCLKCGNHQFYPRARCLACRNNDFSWDIASGNGRIHSFTMVHRAPSAAFDPDVPYLLVLVDLDEGVRIMANMPGTSEDAVSIGSPVRIVFEQRGEIALPQVTLAHA